MLGWLNDQEDCGRSRHRSAIVVNYSGSRRFIHMPTKLTPEILAAAIEGFEAQKQRIDAQVAELRQQLTGGNAGPAAAAEPARKRRTMSAAGRKRVAEAQRKRWAAAKKQASAAPEAAKPEALKPKRKLSAAGRKRIVEATKRRWELVRAAAAEAAK